MEDGVCSLLLAVVRGIRRGVVEALFLRSFWCSLLARVYSPCCLLRDRFVFVFLECLLWLSVVSRTSSSFEDALSWIDQWKSRSDSLYVLNCSWGYARGSSGHSYRVKIQKQVPTHSRSGNRGGSPLFCQALEYFHCLILPRGKKILRARPLGELPIPISWDEEVSSSLIVALCSLTQRRSVSPKDLFKNATVLQSVLWMLPQKISRWITSKSGKTQKRGFWRPGWRGTTWSILQGRAFAVPSASRFGS